MVKTTRWPAGKFLAWSSPQGYFSRWPRDVFTISVFHSCNKITLAGILALVNYNVTDYREQLREWSRNCSPATKCGGRLPAILYILILAVHNLRLELLAGWCRGLPWTTTRAKHLWHIPNDQKWGKAEKCISTSEDSEQANPCCKRWRIWDCPSVKHSDRGEMVVKKSQIGQLEDVALNMKMIKCHDNLYCALLEKSGHIKPREMKKH